MSSAKRERYRSIAVNLSKLLPRRHRVVQPDVPAPFFILGSGRNGSTLLSRILNNHPKLFIPREQYALPFSIMKYRLYNWMEWYDLERVVLSEFADPKNNENWGVDLSPLYHSCASIAKGDRSYNRLFFELHKFLATQYDQQFTLYGDKSPHNIRYIRYLFPVFKHAKFIYLVRDGRAVVSSYTSGTETTFGDLSTEEGAIRNWNECNENWNWLSNRIPKENKLIIRFKDFLNDPEDTLQEITTFLGVSYDDDLLSDQPNFFTDGLEEMEHHQNALKSQLRPERAYKWKEKVSSEDITRLNALMAPGLKSFGYLD